MSSTSYVERTCANVAVSREFGLLLGYGTVECGHEDQFPSWDSRWKIPVLRAICEREEASGIASLVPWMD